MNDHDRETVGVDVSKAQLDAHRLSTGESARFANTAAGFEEFAAWAGDRVAAVAYESTGPFHREFEEALAGRLPMARANALRARRFAQAMGGEAKTDAVDARTLAAMGAAVEVRRVEPRTAALRDLDELARRATRWSRTARRRRTGGSRRATGWCAGSRRTGWTGSTGGSRPWTRRSRRRRTRIRSLSRRRKVPMSIPGIGPAVAAVLLADMPEPGRIDGKAAGSLVGAAPWTRESGQWQGRGFIRGGRARPRRMLCMAAVASLRCNPDMARKDAELRERGKPAKVAPTAVVRKLTVLADALPKQDRTWTPDPVRA